MTMSVPAPPAELRRDAGRGVRRGDGRAALGFLAPSTTGFLLFTLIPLVGSLAISFFAWPVLGRRRFVGLENFTDLLGDPIFHQIMLNTLIFVVVYVPLNIVVSLGLALWISPRIRGRGLYRLLFFIPTVTPMIANALVWRLLYQPGGVIDQTVQTVFGVPAPNFLGDTRWAMAAVILMSVWQGFGYNMLVFSAGLDAIPQSIQEAASIDGAGPFRRFWSVTLPMLSPSMFFAMIMTLITSFQVFVQPQIMTAGGPGIATETVVIHLYREGFVQYELGTASAIGVGLVAALALRRRFRFRGLVRAAMLLPYVAPIVAVTYAWKTMLNPQFGVANHWGTRLLGWDEPIAFLSQRYSDVSIFGWQVGIPTALLTVIAFEAWRSFPFAFLFLTARLQAVPSVLEEAARVDGATLSQRFRYIVLPQLLPTIAVLSVLRFIWTFNSFDDIYLLTGGGAGTEVISVAVFNSLTARGDIGGAAAQSLVLAAFLAVLIGLYLWRMAPREEQS